MSANPRDLIEQASRDKTLELDGYGAVSSKVFESEIELSKAISLKRIADSIEAVRQIFAEAADEGKRERGH